MNKTERKLLKYVDQAEECTSREEALKILNKHAKARAKLLAKSIVKNERNDGNLWPGDV
jgi:hypothetical protein